MSKELTEKCNEIGHFFYKYYLKIYQNTVVSFDRLLTFQTVIKFLIDQKLKLKNDQTFTFAEVGVYKGGTSKLVQLIIDDLDKKNDLKKELWLYDSFAGMPDCDPKKDMHRKGDFADTDLSRVADFLKHYNTLISTNITKCHFPFLNSTDKEKLNYKMFDLVHLDVDIYESYRNALGCFYPKMKKGGVMIFDDYGFDTCPGAKDAVDEFFSNKKEEVRLLKTNQAIVYF